MQKYRSGQEFESYYVYYSDKLRGRRRKEGEVFLSD
jgi:hypothetical protein